MRFVVSSLLVFTFFAITAPTVSAERKTKPQPSAQYVFSEPEREKPNIAKPQFERSSIARPVFERRLSDRARVEKPVFEKPLFERTREAKQERVRPVFDTKWHTTETPVHDPAPRGKKTKVKKNWYKDIRKP